MQPPDNKQSVGLDDLVRKFKGYCNGENDFDELDFKEAIIDHIQTARIDELKLAGQHLQFVDPDYAVDRIEQLEQQTKSNKEKS